MYSLVLSSPLATSIAATCTASCAYSIKAAPLPLELKMLLMDMPWNPLRFRLLLMLALVMAQDACCQRLDDMARMPIAPHVFVVVLVKGLAKHRNLPGREYKQVA